MNIHNNNKYNQSFSGSFRFRNVSPEMQTQISTLITGKGKQVFNDFEKQGDVFLVARDKFDSVIAKFATKNKLNIEYYPQINTKSHLDTECPEILSELLDKNHFQPITTITQFKKFIHNRNRLEYIELKSPVYVNNILKSLCIDNKYPVDTLKGVKIIVDKEFDRKILISPPSKLNIHYVIVQPTNPNKMTERYAISTDGTILQSYKTINGMMKFQERFNSLIVK